MNGSFEEYLLSVPDYQTWYAVRPFQSIIGDWQIVDSPYAEDSGQSSVDLVWDDYWPAHSGRISVDLSGFDAGGIAQPLVGLVPGHRYRITFWVSRNFYTSYSAVSGLVSVGDKGQQLVTYSAPNSFSNMMWEMRSYQFTADSELDFLLFESAMISTGGLVVDDFSIVDLELPENSTSWLVGAGLISLALVGKRQHPRRSWPK
jgi:hypothetical protein